MENIASQRIKREFKEVIRSEEVHDFFSFTLTYNLLCHNIVRFILKSI